MYRTLILNAVFSQIFAASCSIQKFSVRRSLQSSGKGERRRSEQYRSAELPFTHTLVLGSYSRPIVSLVSLQTLSQVYKNDSSLIRNMGKEESKKSASSIGISLDQLDVPNAGWHCSWCFSPSGIRAKLLDAPNSDFPRYGNERAKTSTAYIKRLVKHGIFFNLVRLRNESDEVNALKDPEFAPPFMLRHPKNYQHLLRNPYKQISGNFRASI